MHYHPLQAFMFPWWTPEWNAWGTLSRDPHHVTVFVRDLSRALKWYRSLLVLKIERQTETEAELVRHDEGGIRIRLVSKPDWDAIADVPVLSYEVDVDAFRKRFPDRSRFIRDDDDRAWIRDTEGNVIEFVKRRPLSY